MVEHTTMAILATSVVGTDCAIIIIPVFGTFTLAAVELVLDQLALDYSPDNDTGYVGLDCWIDARTDPKCRVLRHYSRW